jgi:hypothetical protein
MKLYELPRNTKFKIVGDTDENVYLFEKVDGMYSCCFDGDKLFHLAAFAEVIPYDGDPFEKTKA